MGGLRGRRPSRENLVVAGARHARCVVAPGGRRGRAGTRSCPRDRRGLAGRGPGARPGPGRQSVEGPRGQRFHAPRPGPQAGDRGLRRREPRGARGGAWGRPAPGAGAAAISDPLRLLLRAAQGGRRRASGGPRFCARRAGQLGPRRGRGVLRRERHAAARDVHLGSRAARAGDRDPGPGGPESGRRSARVRVRHLQPGHESPPWRGQTGRRRADGLRRVSDRAPGDDGIGQPRPRRRVSARPGSAPHSSRFATWARRWIPSRAARI